MRRPAKALTPAALRRYALRYLDRYATTRAQLRLLMMRQVDASIAAHGGDRARAQRWVDEFLQRLEDGGLIDDRRYAIDRARSLRARGHSERSVQARLAAKRVPPALIRDALDTLRATREDAVDPELEAAARYVRRHRLGAYRDAATRAQQRERDLARLGRRGFPWAVAARVLALEQEEIDALSG